MAGECLTGPNHHFNWRFRSEAANSCYSGGTPCIVDSEVLECLIVGLFQSSRDTAAQNSTELPRYRRTQSTGPIKFIWEELTTFLNRGERVKEERCHPLLPAARRHRGRGASIA